MAGVVRLEVAEGNRLPPFRGESGKAFAEGHLLDERDNGRRNMKGCNELERSLLHFVVGAGLALKVVENRLECLGKRRCLERLLEAGRQWRVVHGNLYGRRLE